MAIHILFSFSCDMKTSSILNRMQGVRTLLNNVVRNINMADRDSFAY